MRYAAHWARCWSLVGAVGIGLAFLVWRPLSVLTVFLTAVLCAGVLLVLVAPAAGPHSPLAAVRWSRIAARAGVVGAGVVALGSFATLVAPLAAPLALAVLLSSPWFLDHVRAWRSRQAPAGRGPTTGPSLVQDRVGPEDRTDVLDTASGWPGPDGCRLDVSSTAAQEMTDAELCREWRHSFVTLESARSAHERLRVVAQRQIYLDEMERRSPTGLQAWLDSGARAAGGPERFLSRKRRTDDQSDAA